MEVDHGGECSNGCGATGGCRHMPLAGRRSGDRTHPCRYRAVHHGSERKACEVRKDVEQIEAPIRQETLQHLISTPNPTWPEKSHSTRPGHPYNARKASTAKAST